MPVRPSRNLPMAECIIRRIYERTQTGFSFPLQVRESSGSRVVYMCVFIMYICLYMYIGTKIIKDEHIIVIMKIKHRPEGRVRHDL